MPFDKVDTQVDFPAQERAALAFWQRTGAFEKLRQKNRGKPRWSFLDGPITANNPMGVHHAWGRTYKDAYNRYFAMTGHELRYQNGFDCQGLWVEVEVEKQLKDQGTKLESKRDIENLVPGDRFASIDRFVRECKERVDRFARIQTDQSIRLGYWMDWDITDEDWAKTPDERKSYFTMSEENNYTIWAFLKKCHQRGLVYRGYDSMPWCPRCAVGISQMEMNEGYRNVAHRAVFLKFPLRKAPPPQPSPTRGEGKRVPPPQPSPPRGEGERVPPPQPSPTRGEGAKDSPSPLVGEGWGGGGAPEGLPENLLVWTTTPWTLTSNVGAAVNPELTYLRVRQGDQIYYVGKGAFTTPRKEEEFRAKTEWVEGVPKLKTLEQFFKEKKGGYEVLGELKGAEMVGWEYDGPFDELPAQQHVHGFPNDIASVVQAQGWAPAVSGKEAHRVVAWNEVGETEGTGIVHIAPGCGKEDFALGKQTGLPPVAPLDEEGNYVDGFGPLTGKSAYEHATTDWILKDLEQKGLLFATEKYPHRYPHCWRCKTELLYRLVDEWFINMDWREEIMAVVEQIRWIPPEGQKQELDWLRNMGDWMISKKRYWGLALPIWVDEQTGDFEVIGSRAELKERAVEGWEQFEGHSPHRPWIDLVKIRNPKTGNLMSRVPDVGNPWLDAGIVPYSTMGYSKDRAEWEKWFPADFITECFPGQFRNWFYALLAMSTMMENRAPFKVLLGHALVRDQKGEEMHKSKGNAIPFDGAVDTGYKLFVKRDARKFKKLEDQAAKDLPSGWLKLEEGMARVEKDEFLALYASYPPMGADEMRWLYCRNNPVANINFGPGPAEEIRSKFLLKMWNVYAFFCNNARQARGGFDLSAPPVPVAERPDLDRWILSDLQALVEKARSSFEAYNVMAFCLEAERFVDDRLSNWYLRRSRRRFDSGDDEKDRLAAYQTLYTVLLTLSKLFAPVMPFLAETLYQNLRASSDPESVHLCDYPVPDPALVDTQLSSDMDALLDLVTLGSAARNAVKIKVRQPLAELKIQPAGERERRAVERFPALLTDELNIKKVTLHSGPGSLLQFEAKANTRTVNLKFRERSHEVQEAIAAANSAELAALVAAGKPFDLPHPSGTITLEPADVLLQVKAAEGWAGAEDRRTLAALDSRITPELALEGMAREVVRFVQNSRKDAKLEIEDRIVLRLDTASEKLQQAIEKHRGYIAEETLTVEWATASLDGGAYQTDVKIEGQQLRVELRRAGK